jgi:hypothetical protein
MKFEFEVTDKGKTRRGVVEGADREQALAALELKGYRVEKLEAKKSFGPSAWSRWSSVSIALCVIGALATGWSALSGFFTPASAIEGQQLMTLEVSGILLGDLESVDKVSVLFPQLPVRVEASWSEVGKTDGSFLLRRELSTYESPPFYFHLKVMDSQGGVLAETTQNRFDPGTGKGLAGSVTLRDP